MLAGYGRYRTTVYGLAIGARYERLMPGAVRAMIRSVVRWSSRRTAFGRKLARTALALPADLTSLYFDNFAVFSRRRQQALLRPALRDRIGSASLDPYAAHAAHLDLMTDRSLLDRLLYVDVKTYLHELLMKQDQMSMAASIESRVPFLDHPLAEFAASLPDRLKLRGWTTKHVLRASMRGILPPAILERRKMGFPVPVGRWLRGPYRWLLDEYVLGDRATARALFEPAALQRLVAEHLAGENHSERLWSLINLEVWHRIFIDGEDAGQVVVEETRGHDLRGMSRPRRAARVQTALRRD
jgi:asparagine synthase (glutamine-hydrolysing)